MPTPANSPIAACLQVAHRRGLALVVERLAELGAKELARRERDAEPQRAEPQHVERGPKRRRRARKAVAT